MSDDKKLFNRREALQKIAGGVGGGYLGHKAGGIAGEAFPNSSFMQGVTRAGTTMAGAYAGMRLGSTPKGAPSKKNGPA